MTNTSEVVADLRIAAEDARRFSAALFDRGYVCREGVRPFSELLERAADTIDRLTSSGEAVAWRTDIFENLPNGKLTRLILDAAEVKDPDPDWKPLFYASPREGHVEVPVEWREETRLVKWADWIHDKSIEGALFGTVTNFERDLREIAAKMAELRAGTKP